MIVGLSNGRHVTVAFVLDEKSMSYSAHAADPRGRVVAASAGATSEAGAFGEILKLVEASCGGIEYVYGTTTPHDAPSDPAQYIRSLVAELEDAKRYIDQLENDANDPVGVVCDMIANEPTIRKVRCCGAERDVHPLDVYHVCPVCGRFMKLRRLGAIGTELLDVITASRQWFADAGDAAARSQIEASAALVAEIRRLRALLAEATKTNDERTKP